jgi:hypothetical protein
MRRLFRLLGLAAAVLVAGCGGGGPGGSDAVCADFRYQEDAQAAYASGADQLDGDNDGIACESLPHRPSGGTGGTGGTGTGGGTSVPPAPAYNLMSALGEVTALTPAGSGQYAMSVWGPFGSVADPGPLGRTASGTVTQVSNSFIGVRYGAKSSDLLPSWSSHGPSVQGAGVGGIGFTPVNRTLIAMSGVYRAIGQACSQGRSPCTPVVGTLMVIDNGTMWVCVNQDANTGQCTAPVVLPVTRNATDPEGMFIVGHVTARMLASFTGSLAVSYQDVYASANNPNPTFTRTTWFGVLYGPGNLAPLGAVTFEGFANAGMLITSSANSWALQDNVPMSGFRRDASGRLMLRGTNGQLITWSPEDGLQTFVQR